MEPEEIASEVEGLAESELLSATWKRVREAGHTDAKETIRVTAETLRVLARRDGCASILRAFHPADQQAFFRNLFLLAEVLPSVRFAASDVESLHHAIPDEVFSDGAIGLYLNAVRSWAKTYPDEAADLAERVVPDARLRILATPILQGLGDASATRGFDSVRLGEIGMQYRAAGPDLLAATVHATPSYVTNGLVTLETVLDELVNLIEGNQAETVASAGVNSVQMLWGTTEECSRLRSLLRQARADSRPLVRLAFTRALGKAWETGDPDDADLVRESIPVLTETAEEHHGIVHEVFWLLYSMAKKETETVLSFLRSWVLRDGDGLDLWHSKRFLNLFPELPRDEFIHALIRWLIEDRRLEETALHVLTFELKVEVLPADEIQALSGNELLMLTLVLASNDHSPGSARLLASLLPPLEKRNDAEEFREEVERALMHAVTNFPSLVERLPQESEMARPSFVGIARRLRSYRDDVGRTRRRAAEMPELACPVERLTLFRRIEAESTAEAMREARTDDPGRTPFLAMAKKVNMLTGGQFFSRIGGRFTAPTPLQRLTTSVEIPQLPVLDPTAETLRRAQIQSKVEALRRGEAE